MPAFLGDAGFIELQREAIKHDFASVVDPSDVNPSAARFSFDFPSEMLITGDMLEISSTDDQPLAFIDSSGWPDGIVYPDGVWFIHVDQVGGIKLYDRFDEAVAGEYSGRIPLRAIDTSIPVRVKVKDAIERCVAEVTSYELSTDRQAVDVTELSSEFQQRWSTLISGSGQIECNFDYKHLLCNDWEGVDGWEPELPIYLHQLVLRQQLGSEFHAHLFLIARGRGHDENDEIWHEFDGVMTNAAVTVEPTGLLRSRFQFVTTGEVKLKVRSTSQYLLQENRDRLALERRQGRGFIEQESDLAPADLLPPRPPSTSIHLLTDTGALVATNAGDQLVVRL